MCFKRLIVLILITFAVSATLGTAGKIAKTKMTEASYEASVINGIKWNDSYLFQYKGKSPDGTACPFSQLGSIAIESIKRIFFNDKTVGSYRASSSYLSASAYLLKYFSQLLDQEFDVYVNNIKYLVTGILDAAQFYKRIFWERHLTISESYSSTRTLNFQINLPPAHIPVCQYSKSNASLECQKFHVPKKIILAYLSVFDESLLVFIRAFILDYALQSLLTQTSPVKFYGIEQSVYSIYPKLKTDLPLSAVVHLSGQALKPMNIATYKSFYRSLGIYIDGIIDSYDIPGNFMEAPSCFYLLYGARNRFKKFKLTLEPEEEEIMYSDCIYHHIMTDERLKANNVSKETFEASSYVRDLIDTNYDLLPFTMLKRHGAVAALKYFEFMTPNALVGFSRLSFILTFIDLQEDLPKLIQMLELSVSTYGYLPFRYFSTELMRYGSVFLENGYEQAMYHLVQLMYKSLCSRPEPRKRIPVYKLIDRQNLVKTMVSFKSNDYLMLHKTALYASRVFGHLVPQFDQLAKSARTCAEDFVSQNHSAEDTEFESRWETIPSSSIYIL